MTHKSWASVSQIYPSIYNSLPINTPCTSAPSSFLPIVCSRSQHSTKTDSHRSNHCILPLQIICPPHRAHFPKSLHPPIRSPFKYSFCFIPINFSADANGKPKRSTRQWIPLTTSASLGETDSRPGEMTQKGQPELLLSRQMRLVLLH